MDVLAGLRLMEDALFLLSGMLTGCALLMAVATYREWRANRATRK